MKYINMEIILKSSEILQEDYQEDDIELMFDYLEALYRNGQIYKNYNVIKANNGFNIFVTIPECDSLDKKYFGKYVSDYSKRVFDRYTININQIGEDLDYFKPCVCENPDWFYINTQPVTDSSPIMCGNCRKPRPLYRLPYNTEYDEFFTLQRWQRNYNSVDRLWFSGISDRFTYRQMNNPLSALSKEGREICAQFEQVTGKPFYYYIFHYSETRKKNINCPLCGKSWVEIQADDFVSKKCEDCRLITN